MKQLNGRVLYRLPIALYFIFALVGFFILPFGVLITLTKKGEARDLILALTANFVPYLLLGSIIIAITSFLKLKRSSAKRRKTAMGVSIFSIGIVIWSIVNLLRYASLRWEGTYPNTGSMNGGPEWITGWMGGCASGLIVLCVGYLILSRHIQSAPLE